MKRRAILIANTNGLPGTTLDVNFIRKFLLSDHGGRWHNNEIDCLINPSRTALFLYALTAKSEMNDFMIVHFSGHGGQAINSVTLEINEKGETINSTDLFNLAPRQVSIFDCCRVSVSPSLETAKATASFSETYKDYRKIYADRIMSSAEQQLKLYACASGETAGEDSNGGYYSQSLFKAALRSKEPFYTFNQAHSAAAETVHGLTNGKQNPEVISGRHLSSQNLVISIS